jgi:hypothetical protein
LEVDVFRRWGALGLRAGAWVGEAGQRLRAGWLRLFRFLEGMPDGKGGAGCEKSAPINPINGVWRAWNCAFEEPSRGRSS